MCFWVAFCSIFQTETGTLERRKVLVNIEDKGPKKEPKPGEAYFKLKSELGRKIEERRRQAIAKRLEEEKAKKQEEEEEAENDEEELDDDEYELGSDDEAESKKRRTAKIDAETEELVLDEAEDDASEGEEAKDGEAAENGDENEGVAANDGNENDSEESEEDDSDGEVDATDVGSSAAQPRRRIIAMDDDSDDDGEVFDEVFEKYLNAQIAHVWRNLTHFGVFTYSDVQRNQADERKYLQTTIPCSKQTWICSIKTKRRMMPQKQQPIMMLRT